MKVTIHAHARQRIRERGTSVAEVIETVRTGNKSGAKFQRACFTKVFSYNGLWLGKRYSRKRVEAFAAQQADASWLVVTVIVMFF